MPARKSNSAKPSAVRKHVAKTPTSSRPLEDYEPGASREDVFEALRLAAKPTAKQRAPRPDEALSGT